MYERIEQRLCFSVTVASHRTQSAEPESVDSMSGPAILTEVSVFLSSVSIAASDSRFMCVGYQAEIAASIR